MNIKLTPELEKLVQDKVGSGRYGSASEVVREALRLMEHRDESRVHQLQEIRGRMDLALQEVDEGQSVDGEPFMQGLMDDLDARYGRKAG